MSRYILDTNSVIYALNQAFKLPNNDYFISFVTEMELLSFSDLTQDGETVLRLVLQSFVIAELSQDIKSKAIWLRKTYKLKLPDSIIVATAIIYDACLVTSDKQLLKLDCLKSLQPVDLK